MQHRGEPGRGFRRFASGHTLLALALITLIASLCVVSFPTTDASPASQGKANLLSSASQDTVLPSADAGDDFVAYVNITTELNGSASTDNVGIETYTWTFEDNGTQTLPGEVATYVFVSPGFYNVTLNVTDFEGNWDTDVVMITVKVDITPPRVYPGFNITVYTGYPYELNGSRSNDPETGIVNYTWNFTYSGEAVVLYGPIVFFTFEETGEYVVTLTLTNGVGLVNASGVTITVEKPPTWLDRHWLGLTIGLLILGLSAVYVYRKIRRDKVLLTRAEMEKLQLKYKDAKRVWRLFRTNRLGFSGFLVLCGFGAMAILAPWICAVQDPNMTANHETIQPDWDNPSPPTMAASKYTGFIHLLGTDSIGQDVYSLTLYGARASLLVGFVATFISIALGVSIGLASGYFGRFADEVLMRFTDYFLVLPWFPLMIVLMTVLGQEFIYVILVIGVTSWPSTARIVRSQVLSVRERSFIERAKAIGAGDAHIISKHIFPNVLPLVFANMVLLISLAIFSEAYLDFFGLGDPDVISWGTMLETAYEFGAFDYGAWWWILPPSISIILCVLAFSLVGYALDDIFNPKLRRR